MTLKNSEYPLVSIITINYDHPEVTCELLESLRKITYPNIEIIVVDNASPNDDQSVIKEKHPEIIFIQSDKNLGFAGGNNLGIRKSKGKYILLLNNDTEVDTNFLQPLVNKCENNKKVGAVSPKIYYFYDKKIIQWAGNYKMNKFTMRCMARGWLEKENGQYDSDWKSFYNHGAAMLVPRTVIDKIGLMSEVYFLYYEELDWSERIRNSGYEIYYVHNSMIYHKESISTGTDSPLKTYYMNRGRFIFLRKNVHGITFFLALLYMIFISIPKNLFELILKQKWTLTKSYINSITWNLKNLFNKDIFLLKKL